jgi:mycofactocin precursor
MADTAATDGAAVAHTDVPAPASAPACAPAPAPDRPAEELVLDDELLVEDVSIDGMCGVY